MIGKIFIELPANIIIEFQNGKRARLNPVEFDLQRKRNYYSKVLIREKLNSVLIKNDLVRTQVDNIIGNATNIIEADGRYYLEVNGEEIQISPVELKTILFGNIL